MATRRLLVALLLPCWLTGAAAGQFVPPVPAKTPATPEYSPPKPPPQPPPVPPTTPEAQPQPPAPPEEPLPSIVERDEKGNLKPLKVSVDEAAVRALKVDDAARAKIDAAMAARRDDVDRLVIEKIDVLLRARRALAETNESTSVGDMLAASTPARVFAEDKLLARLVREGAITAAQKSRAEQIVKEYRQAANTESIDRVGHNNIQAMALAGFRFTVYDMTIEAMASLDRQLGAAESGFEKLLAGLDPGLSKEQKAVVDKRRGPHKKGVGRAERLEACHAVFFEVLDTDQQRALLTAASPGLFEKKPAEGKGAGGGEKK